MQGMRIILKMFLYPGCSRAVSDIQPFFVRVPRHVISLQLFTPKLVGV
jgi:hypothetical protein